MIVIVGPGVGHLNDFALPGEGIIEYFFTQHQILISYPWDRAISGYSIIKIELDSITLASFPAGFTLIGAIA